MPSLRYVVQEVTHLVQLLRQDVNVGKVVSQTLGELPRLTRQLALQWSDAVLAS